jgi:hypothetical protein
MASRKASVPPVHWRHLGDAAIGSKDHAERNVHRSHVDVHAIGAPAVAVVQLRLQALRGLRFGGSRNRASEQTKPCQIGLSPSRTLAAAVDIRNTGQSKSAAPPQQKNPVKNGYGGFCKSVSDLAAPGYDAGARDSPGLCDRLFRPRGCRSSVPPDVGSVVLRLAISKPEAELQYQYFKSATAASEAVDGVGTGHRHRLGRVWDRAASGHDIFNPRSRP